MEKQFDLEEQIMDCWGVIDDIKILSEHVMEDDDADTDSIANTLIGIESLYRLKFEKLFRTFETAIKTSHQYDREIERLRERLEKEYAGHAEVNKEWVAQPSSTTEQVDDVVGFPVFSAYKNYNEGSL